jgi:hypothetical protein
MANDPLFYIHGAAWTGLPGQGWHNRTARIIQPGQDCKDRTARPGHAEQDKQNWTGRTDIEHLAKKLGLNVTFNLPVIRPASPVTFYPCITICPCVFYGQLFP